MFLPQPSYTVTTTSGPRHCLPLITSHFVACIPTTVGSLRWSSVSSEPRTWAAATPAVSRRSRRRWRRPPPASRKSVHSGAVQAWRTSPRPSAAARPGRQTGAARRPRAWPSFWRASSLSAGCRSVSPGEGSDNHLPGGQPAEPLDSAREAILLLS